PGGTMTTRSTPASSIIGSARSMVNGSGNCGLTPGSQGQSGELAFQKCTWASTIVRLLAGCGRACCALVVSAAPATSGVPMNVRRVSMMVLLDGARSLAAFRRWNTATWARQSAIQVLAALTGHLPAGTVQAGDESLGDWIAGGKEDDRNRSRRCLCGQHSREVGDDDGDLTASEIGRQLR